MKSTLTFLAIMLTIWSYAQIRETNSVGLRVGNSDGFSTGVAYQRYFNDHLRAEVVAAMQEHDLYDSYVARLMGQYGIFINRSNFELFGGVGLGAGSSRMQAVMAKSLNINEDKYMLYAAQAGMQYHFNEGFTLGFDVTPEFYNTVSRESSEIEYAVSLRHRF